MNFACYVLLPGAEAVFLLDGISKFCYDSSCVNSKFLQIFLHVSEKKDDNQQICGKNRVKDTKYANAMDNGAVCHIWRKK